MKNAVSKKDEFVEDRSYKETWHTEKIFMDLVDRRDRWERCLDELIIEVVKAANWFADIVRRDINPLFIATNGKFSLIWGPDDNLAFHTIVYEYSNEERKQLIDSYEEKYIDLKKKADAIEI